MITKTKFSGLAALAIALPTVIVLMTSAVVWRTVFADEAKSKPIIL
jgi:ABC-type sugar transport system permease subunit